jgi:dephospho-CoA kinase
MTDEKKSYMKLGVTGGIGSGKSTVCKVFNTLGISVYSSDPEAQKIMNSDSEIIKKINSIAGRNLYSTGVLDRQELAALIFNNKSLLEKVNSVVHPAVAAHFKQWTMEQASPYIIMESAILFESGASRHVDRIATVVAPEEERISRVIERNRLTREQVIERIRNQMNDEERIKLSDYVISNSENDMIIPSVLKIHEDILSSLNLHN